MAEQRDYIGMEWVEGEIKATLTDTRNSLEQYAESNGDTRFLTQCQAQLQQMASTMKMLEQHTALLLTEEMLELLLSMDNLSGKEVQEHLVVLMQGLLLLPDYLEQVSRSGRDEPKRLKPILRRMRQLRKQPFLEDAVFFAPDINTPSDPLMSDQLDILRSKGFVPLLRKIRQKYQLCLAGIIRDNQRNKQLDVIGKIFAKLQNYCWGAPLAPLWDAAAGLAEGLKEGSISLDSDSNILLRELDHQLKLLTISDTEGLNEKPSVPLLRHLLYRIALAESKQPLITSLNFRYNLDEALLAAQEEPEEELFNLKATQQAVANIREELIFIKDTLDLYSDNPELYRPQLEEQLPVIEQLANTLSMLGMDRQHHLLADQVEALQSILDGAVGTESLVNVTEQLLHIETALSHFSSYSDQISGSGVNVSDAHRVVISETKHSIEEEIEAEEVSTVNEEATNDIKGLFLKEASIIHGQLAHHFEKWHHNPDNQQDSLKVLHQCFQLLKTNSRLYHAEVIGELALSIENMLNSLLDGHIEVCGQMLELLEEFIQCLPDLMADFASNDQAFTPEVVVCLEKADSLGKGSLFITDEDDVIGEDEAEFVEETQPEETQSEETIPENSEPAFHLNDAELVESLFAFQDEQIPEVAEEYIQQQTVEISLQTERDNAPFIVEDLKLLLVARRYLEQWTNAIPVVELDCFKTELNLLSESADKAHINSLVQLCDVLLDVCDYLDKRETVLPLILLQPLINGFETLVDMMNQALEHQTPDSPEIIFHELRNALLMLHKECATGSGSLSDLIEDEIVLQVVEQAKEKSATSSSIAVDEHDDSSLLNLFVEESFVEESFVEESFVEESFERIESITATLEKWLKDIGNLKYVNELQRDLHTLKGGALLAEQNELAELCHSIEDIYQSVSTQTCKPEEAPLALIQQALNTIEGMLSALRYNKPVPSPVLLLKQLKQWSPDIVSATPVASTSEPIEILPDYLGSAGKVSEAKLSVPEIASVKALPMYTPPLTAKDLQPKQAVHSPSDMIRIPVELLESLIDLAGEASITRSGLEQQLADSNKLLDDMSVATLRIKEQLHRLDSEARLQNEITRDKAGFDSLELEEHSSLTQLSHSLVETASELMGVGEALQQSAKEGGRLLRQQGRTQTELHEQLMKAQMDSFSRLVPRLRKTVRQTSEELGKYVDLDVINAEREMDRNILECMQAPLEHMLRNAVSHGIEESPEARLALGKPEKGTISLSVQQDGSDIIIEVADDGSGIDLQSVRERAIEKQLVSKDTVLSDQEAMQLILHSGFSTAESITNLSGRGVGMDVVNSEVRRLGGTIMIGSEKGVGARFSLRLPLTQSNNQALLVEVGSHLYAVPLSSIDGVSMVDAEKLMDCYQNSKPLLYGGVEHKVFYMGNLLDRQSPKPLDEQCAVVLVERENDKLALHVDSLLGTQEVVTKRLGTQFSGLIGVKGASILGDGRVVIIIDPAALYRRFSLHGGSEILPEINTQKHAAKVLVVDDSVTVRKVTSRLLSRHGYEVDSARDGVEALAKVAENQPDLILLDIEMPNMDGFEVASSIRNNIDTKDMPIIMVTSRTGEKHRNRALDLGVNDYIGKPFQEGPLLEAISKLVVKV